MVDNVIWDSGIDLLRTNFAQEQNFNRALRQLKAVHEWLWIHTVLRLEFKEWEQLVVERNNFTPKALVEARGLFQSLIGGLDLNRYLYLYDLAYSRARDSNWESDELTFLKRRFEVAAMNDIDQIISLFGG